MKMMVVVMVRELGASLLRPLRLSDHGYSDFSNLDRQPRPPNETIICIIHTVIEAFSLVSTQLVEEGSGE